MKPSPIHQAPHDGSATWVQSQCYGEEDWAFFDAGTGRWCWCDNGEFVDPSAEAWLEQPPEGAPLRPNGPFKTYEGDHA